jgi:hypothetical protein
MVLLEGRYAVEEREKESVTTTERAGCGFVCFANDVFGGILSSNSPVLFSSHKCMSAWPIFALALQGNKVPHPPLSFATTIKEA